MTFIRYIIIQLFAYGIDMESFYLIITGTSHGPIAGNIAGKLLAGIFAFLCHRHITFHSAETGSVWRQALRYFPLLAIMTPVSSAVLAVLLKWISHPVPAKIAADIICVAITYFLSRNFVFTGNFVPGVTEKTADKAQV